MLYQLDKIAVAGFKNKSIGFQRKVDKASQTHTFEFPGNDLTLTMCPYDLVNGLRLGRDAVSKKVVVDSLGVLVTVYNVGAENQAFAEKLIMAVDEVAEQLLQSAEALQS